MMSFFWIWCYCWMCWILSFIFVVWRYQELKKTFAAMDESKVLFWISLVLSGGFAPVWIAGGLGYTFTKLLIQGTERLIRVIRK